VGETRKEADLIAAHMGENKLAYVFIPMATCYIQILNSGYVLEDRKFIFPKDISKATRGRTVVYQADKLKRLLEEKGGVVVECDHPHNPAGRRQSQKGNVGEF